MKNWTERKTRGVLALSLLLLMSVSLVAGTTAIYQSTLDYSNVTVTAKDFVFTCTDADATAWTVADIAPTETANEHIFKVTNWDAITAYSEVDISVAATAAFTPSTAATNAATAAGFTFSASSLSVVASYCDTIDGTYTTGSSFTLTKNAADTVYLKVAVSWTGTGTTDSDANGLSDDAELQGLTLGTITLSIVGTQA